MTDKGAVQITEDSLFAGDLVCRQHRLGYRFSIDPVLLAHFISPSAGARVLDMGAGCGIISLLLAYRYSQISVTALELQPALVDLIRQNSDLNGFSQRIMPVCVDLCQIEDMVKAESYDLVVANPPYGSPGSGRQNLESERAIARHEVHAGLDDVVRAAAFAVANRRKIAMVYPASRLVALLGTMTRHRLQPRRLRVVHSYPGGRGQLVLVEAMKNGGEDLQLLPPLYVYQEKGGAYSKEVAAMYEKRRDVDERV